MFTLAHISDLHIAPLPPASLRQLASKRFLGWLSWKRRRQAIHRREILDRIAADLLSKGPDHVAVTGDLINISLPEEFRQAEAWLRDLGAADWISVVPGNHDAYVTQPWHGSLSLWQDYMASDGAQPDPTADWNAGFPFLRRRGPLAVIGLSTALPTLPGSAGGRLGTAQLEDLRRRLVALRAEDCFRCILLHHPPAGGRVVARKSLGDAREFAAVIAEAGAELVLHGHVHSFNEAQLQGPAGAVPVLGVPSASAVPGRHQPGGHYHLYRIARAEGGWRVEIQPRGLGHAGAAPPWPILAGESRSIFVAS